jgi:hypothetical protein
MLPRCALKRSHAPRLVFFTFSKSPRGHHHWLPPKRRGPEKSTKKQMKKKGGQSDLFSPLISMIYARFSELPILLGFFNAVRNARFSVLSTISRNFKRGCGQKKEERARARA